MAAAAMDKANELRSKLTPQSKRISELEGDAHKETFILIMNVGGIISGLAILIAGCVGTFSGVQVMKIWPPLTWNAAVSGVFMALFGLFTIWICAFSKSLAGDYQPSVPGQGDEPLRETLLKHFGFLDTYLGRGAWFIFCGLRVLPLGFSFCLAAGLFTILFGLCSILLHFMVSAEPKTACTIMNVATGLISGADMVAGALGLYYGTSVIQAWPPLTWDHCVSSFFVFLFGLATFWVAVRGNTPGDWVPAAVKKYIGFIDFFGGRGVLFIFCALRIIPLGQAVNAIIGMLTLAFGFLNIAAEFAIKVDEDGISATGEAPFALASSFVVLPKDDKDNTYTYGTSSTGPSSPNSFVSVDIPADQGKPAYLTQLSKEQVEQLSQVFKQMDKDKSGKLEQAELFKTGKIFNPNFTEEKCNKLLQKIDGDGDGLINLTEWLTFFGHFIPALPEDKAKKGVALLLEKTK